MHTARRAKILATGMYVPPRIVTNKDLEQWMETSDEWIQQRTGIKQRHFVEPGVGPSELGLKAAQVALNNAGLKPDQIDMIIVATLSPDYYFPGTAVFIQDMLGLSTTPAMDIRNQCSGFLYSLNVAKLFVESGQYKRVLVIGAEVHSAAINLSTKGRDVSVLFGDGAGAFIIEGSDSHEREILSVYLHAEGKYRDKLKIEFPSTRKRPFINEEIVAEGLMYPVMDGKYVFKHATKRLLEVVQEALAAQNLAAKDVDHFVFHQANLRINEFVMQELGEPMSKAYSNIQNYGNCSAASIPICFHECVSQQRFKAGDLICLAAFGAGFTWASSLVRW